MDEQDLLDVLACEIDVRPRDAPTIDDLRPYIVRAERRPDALIIHFADEGALAVASFVEAERLCCAGLTWTLEKGAPMTLTIGATSAQLDALATMFG